MANDIGRLGRYVEARRKELGMTQVDVWQSGGPSNSTLTGLETGVAATVSPATLRKLDASLNWELGSAQAILDGNEPIALGGSASNSAPPRPAGVAEPDPSMPLSLEDREYINVVRRIVNFSIELHDFARQHPNIDFGPLLRSDNFVVRSTLIGALASQTAADDSRYFGPIAEAMRVWAARTSDRPERPSGEVSVYEAFLDRPAAQSSSARSTPDDFEPRRTEQAKTAAKQWPTPDPSELARGPLADNADDLIADHQAPEPDYQLAARKGESEEHRRRRLEVAPEDLSQDTGPDEPS